MSDTLLPPKERPTLAPEALDELVSLTDRDYVKRRCDELLDKIDAVEKYLAPIHDAIVTARVFDAIHDINNKLTGYAELAELLRNYANDVAATQEAQRQTMLEQRKVAIRLDLAGISATEDDDGGKTNGS